MALSFVGVNSDGDTPPKQRMVGWRGDLQTATSGTPANDWAGLSQEQEALLGALQVPPAAPSCMHMQTVSAISHCTLYLALL